VSFTVARFPPRRVPALLASVPAERLRLRRTPGVAWGRHLGTSAGGRTLGADPSRWAWLAAWDDEAAADGFHDALVDRLRPDEAGTLHLRCTRARGSWGGRQLRADPAADAGGPVVVLTRARVRARSWRAFTAAIPPVDDDLAVAPGLVRSVGIGEWPVLVQGTVSAWEDAEAVMVFARRTEAHRGASRRSGDEGWYAEELFARFAVARTQGAWDGPLALG
jgi:hypothetical protein